MQSNENRNTEFEFQSLCSWAIDINKLGENESFYMNLQHLHLKYGQHSWLILVILNILAMYHGLNLELQNSYSHADHFTFKETGIQKARIIQSWLQNHLVNY